jgi:hypothetical protein
MPSVRSKNTAPTHSIIRVRDPACAPRPALPRPPERLCVRKQPALAALHVRPSVSGAALVGAVVRAAAPARRGGGRSEAIPIPIHSPLLTCTPCVHTLADTVLRIDGHAVCTHHLQVLRPLVLCAMRMRQLRQTSGAARGGSAVAYGRSCGVGAGRPRARQVVLERGSAAAAATAGVTCCGTPGGGRPKRLL